MPDNVKSLYGNERDEWIESWITTLFYDQGYCRPFSQIKNNLPIQIHSIVRTSDNYTTWKCCITTIYIISHQWEKITSGRVLLASCSIYMRAYERKSWQKNHVHIDTRESCCSYTCPCVSTEVTAISNCLLQRIHNTLDKFQNRTICHTTFKFKCREVIQLYETASL